MQVNGKPFAENPRDLAQLLKRLGYDEERQGIAVAVNGTIVPRSRWRDRRLDDCDEVEIVGAVQGG